MPIKGNLLYLMRWWYRATVDNSAPVESHSQTLPSAPGAPKTTAAPASQVSQVAIKE